MFSFQTLSLKRSVTHVLLLSHLHLNSFAPLLQYSPIIPEEQVQCLLILQVTLYYPQSLKPFSRPLKLLRYTIFFRFLHLIFILSITLFLPSLTHSMICSKYESTLIVSTVESIQIQQKKTKLLIRSLSL